MMVAKHMTEHDELRADFAQSYAEARRRFPTLPELEEIDHEWDILDAVGREGHKPVRVVRFVRWYIMGAVNGWNTFLHEFVMPNPQSMPSMEEYNLGNDMDRGKIKKILDWMAYRNRCVSLVQLDEDDKKSADLIKEIFSEWRQHKSIIRELLEKSRDGWNKQLQS
jgi:hypothetical protein